jgi:hypothetical protein
MKLGRQPNYAEGTARYSHMGAIESAERAVRLLRADNPDWDEARFSLDLALRFIDTTKERLAEEGD